MVNPPILAADKVQNLKSITEGDTYIEAIQDMLITASFPMVKLWDSILKNDKNLDAEQVVNLVQQSLCAIGSAFRSLNTHRQKRFQGCLTKEFRSLADDQPNKSETTLSPWLFGSNLEEQIKSKVDSSTISRKVISREIPRFRTNPFQNQNRNFPNSRSQRRGKRRSFLPQNQYQRHHQQKEVSQHTSRLSQQAIDQDILFPRTHQFLGAWEQITNDPEILEIIEGYSIKFQHTPFQMGPPPPLRTFSEGEMAAIDKEIVDLLKKGAIEVCSHTPGEFISNIRSSKTEWWKQACNRHESAKRVHGEHPFQNGRHIPAKICSQTGRFYDKTGFKGHISNCPSKQKIENLPSLYLEGCTLPIHLPPFQSLFLRQNFHQGYKTSDCISKGNGDQIINSSRRHINHGKLSPACNATHGLGNPSLNLLGICDKLPKVHSHPFKGVAIPELQSKLRSNETFLAKRKASKFKTVCYRNHVPSSHCKPCSKFSRSLSVNHACDSRNPPLHQGNTEGSHKGHSPSRTTCFLQNQGHPFSGGNKRSAVVDRFSPLKQWKRHNSATCKHNDFLQCLKNRMGCPSGFNPDRCKMVKKRGQFPQIFWN